MTIIQYVIEVTYPPNAGHEDFEKMLDELTGAASKYGLGVDGYYREAEE